MPFRIQRVPRGLNELLSIFGGGTPTELEDRVRSVLELTQYYGLQHLQSTGQNNPAAAEAVTVSFVPSATRWVVLFSANASVVKTATMTALRMSVLVNRTSGVNCPYASCEGGPFGATETGVVNCPWVAPYPMLCPPGTAIGAVANIIGTDATADVTIRAEFGLLG